MFHLTNHAVVGDKSNDRQEARTAWKTDPCASALPKCGRTGFSGKKALGKTYVFEDNFLQYCHFESSLNRCLVPIPILLQYALGPLSAQVFSSTGQESQDSPPGVIMKLS